MKLYGPALAAVLLMFAACSGDDGTSDNSDTGSGDVVTDNDAPIVSIVRPAQRALVPAGEDVLFTGSVADDHDPTDALDIKWTSDRVSSPLNEDRASDSGNTTFQTDALEPGEHLITLTATDSGGRTGSANVLITVNEGPGAPGIAIAPLAPNTADDLRASVTTDATDPNRAASELTYRYRWFKGGEFADVTTPTVSHTLTARGDVWEVRVQANDGLVEGAEGKASVTVGNAAPSCTAASIFPTAANTDEALDCTCSDWDDSDDDAAADSCEFFDGATAIAGQDGSCTLPASLTERGMDVRCVYTPNDGTDAGESRESTSVPILNGAPSMPTVVLTPDAANALTELSCTLGDPSVDPDGDSISYAVAWLVDGYENSGVSTGTVVAGALETSDGTKARKGNKVSCRLRASDGTATSAPAESAELTLDNAPPTVGPVLIMPTGGATQLDENAVLSCNTSGATDPDGDSVTLSYTWTVNGEVVDGAVSQVLDGSSFDRDDVVGCTITATDGQATSEPIDSKSPVTIQNAPPTLLSATITPANANPFSLLTCTPEGWSDPDGDALEVSYAWYQVGGDGSRTLLVGVDGGTYTPDTMADGDQILCAVTPRNGAETGPTVESAAITLVAPEPTAPTVTVAAPDGAGGAVRCDFITPAMHFPSTPSYTYFWTINGGAENEGGPSLTGLTDCDLVSCRAVATLGDTVESSDAAELLLPVGDDCNTGELCRTPTCQAEGGCTTLAANDVPCDDGNPCTLNDYCDFGTCVQETMADNTVACDDGLYCTAESFCDGQGGCVGSGDPCATGDDSCVIGTCVEDGDRCDYADKPNDTGCNDGNGCTAIDTCQDGACIPGDQQDCSHEDDACHVGTCVADGDAAYTCEPVAKAADTPCVHPDFCTVNTTCDAAGVCGNGEPRDCQAEAGDACHTATCDSAEQRCVVLTTPDGTACDDEDECTQFDTCRNGVCLGPDKVCVELRQSNGGTAGFAPVVASIGSGRYTTQWYAAGTGGQRIRRTTSFDSREWSEWAVPTTFSSNAEAVVVARWETRIATNRAGDHMFLVMTEAGTRPGIGVIARDYLGAELASTPEAIVLGEDPPPVSMDQWSVRTLPITTTDDVFGIVYGARWVGTEDPADEVKGIMYAPPTGMGAFGTHRALVAPGDGATDVLAFDAVSLDDGTGDFVVAWVAPDKATVRIKRFSEAGIPKTPNWTEIAPRGEISALRIAALGEGQKALVIEQPGGVDGDGEGIYSVVLDASDALVGDWAQVSEGFYGDQRLGEVSAFDDGGFVVVYDDQYGDTDGYSVFAQLYANDGAKYGPAIAVNTRKAGDQYQPSVAVLDTQHFVVAFRDDAGIVWTFRYKRDGQPSVIRPEMRVNATTPASQSAARAAALVDGTVLVAYNSPIAGRTDTEILARIVDPFGVEELPELMVNVNDSGNQYAPDVGAGPDRFVVAWHGNGRYYGRIVDPDVGPVGGQIQLFDQERRAEIAVSPTDGKFLAATTRSVSGGRPGVIRLFDADGTALTGYVTLPNTLHNSESVAAHPLGEGYAVGSTTSYEAYVHKVNASGSVVGTIQGNGRREQALFSLAFATDGASFLACQFITWGTDHLECQRFTWQPFAKAGPPIYIGTTGYTNPAWLDDQRFVVAHNYSDSNGSAVQVARYFQSGLRDKPAFIANQTWAGTQSTPFVVKALGSDYLVGWQSENQDGSGYAIIMRLFPGY